MYSAVSCRNREASREAGTSKIHGMSDDMVRLSRLEIQELNHLKRVNKIQIGNWNQNLNVVKHNPGSESLEWRWWNSPRNPTIPILERYQ